MRAAIFVAQLVLALVSLVVLILRPPEDISGGAYLGPRYEHSQRSRSVANIIVIVCMALASLLSLLHIF